MRTVSLLLLAIPAHAQDLIDRMAREHRLATAWDRLALPRPLPKDAPEEKRVRSVKLPDLIGAAGLDPRKFLRDLLREEIVDADLDSLLRDAQRALARHAMTLLCQASPTICNLVKHQRANANALQDTLQQQLASLAGQIPGVDRLARIEALDGCLRERLRRDGRPLDAFAACARQALPLGLDGKPMRMLDLQKEIGKFLGLSREDRDLLSSLTHKLRLTAGGIERETTSAVRALWKDLREKHKAVWERAFTEPTMPPELRDLALRKEDVAHIAAMPVEIREPTTAVLADSFALVDLKSRALRARQWLKEVEGSPGVPETVREMTRAELKELDEDIALIEERVRLQGLAQEAVLRARGAGERYLADTFRRLTESLRAMEQRARFDRESAPWGSLPKRGRP